MNGLHIDLPSIRGFKAKSYNPILAIIAVDIAAIQTELREVRGVKALFDEVSLY
jgi:hypothetical protein